MCIKSADSSALLLFLLCLLHLGWVWVLFSRIGGESLAVAQNTYAVSWFKGKELNLVFGLQLSMARIVSLDRWEWKEELCSSFFGCLGVFLGLLLGVLNHCRCFPGGAVLSG